MDVSELMVDLILFVICSVHAGFVGVFCLQILRFELASKFMVGIFVSEAASGF